MKKREFLLFFILPFLLVVGLFTLLSNLNRQYIQARIQELARDQLSATALILKESIRAGLERGLPASEVLKPYQETEDIYFMAILDSQENVLDWTSRFEGYLPLSQKERPPGELWIIDSPEGKIFNHYSALTTADGRKYYFYLGYSLKSLDVLLAYSKRNFWYILSALALAGLLIFAGLYRLHRSYQLAAAEAARQAEEKEKFKEISAYTSGVAHEIKNPLNSLALLFEDWQSLNISQISQELEKGKDEVEKIGRIVDSFSEALKPVSLSLEKFEVGSVIEEEIKELENLAEEKNLKIDLKAEDGLKLTADRLLFGRVVSNLLKNAIEASPEGGLVSVKAYVRKKKVILEVEDSGSGIEETQAEKIFEPFISNKSSGFGIGLYLTRKIVAAHGGKISFSNRPGGGAVFKVEMPGGESG
ncbi:MAG TPA: HAMP domain-containing sensor histidine kinase [Candidatus Saccharicenans sp.]|nr:HAMP domain-containing sensor histidine kinase [Candidatus Saccharicenans sp.]HOM95003.1 HAMP domain-containing sensor histidine kinase [Candidatus Saccharicenans sp.]HQH61224.1 HAMP domain-containing sensor histidine kinase [Candidatus Saccharicenans sp.]